MSKLVCARGATVRGIGRTSLPFLFNVRLLALLLCASIWYPAMRLISCPPALSFACGALVRPHLALAFTSEVAFFRQTLCGSHPIRVFYRAGHPACSVGPFFRPCLLGHTNSVPSGCCYLRDPGRGWACQFCRKLRWRHCRWHETPFAPLWSWP